MHKLVGWELVRSQEHVSHGNKVEASEMWFRHGGNHCQSYRLPYTSVGLTTWPILQLGLSGQLSEKLALLGTRYLIGSVGRFLNGMFHRHLHHKLVDEGVFSLCMSTCELKSAEDAQFLSSWEVEEVVVDPRRDRLSIVRPYLIWSVGKSKGQVSCLGKFRIHFCWPHSVVSSLPSEFGWTTVRQRKRMEVS